MSLYKILKLADRFENKIFEEKHDVIFDKLQDLVKSCYPFVADNNLKDKGDYFELVIEIMDTPHYTSDKPKHSNEEFKNYINSVVDIIKNQFDIIELSIKDTSNTFVSDGKVIAIIFKVAK